MTTTRRLVDRDASESAARRPRPNVDRPEPALLPEKVRPRCPAFFAARITSPTKLFAFFAPWLPCRMRPGRGVKLSSRLFMALETAAMALDLLKSLAFQRKAPAERLC